MRIQTCDCVQDDLDFIGNWVLVPYKKGDDQWKNIYLYPNYCPQCGKKYLEVKDDN